MRYDPAKGIFGNIEWLFVGTTENSENIIINKAQLDADILQLQADVVQAVIDEYDALIEDRVNKGE